MLKRVLIPVVALCQVGFSAIQGRSSTWDSEPIDQVYLQSKAPVGFDVQHDYEMWTNYYTFSWSPISSPKEVEYAVYVNSIQIFTTKNQYLKVKCSEIDTALVRKGHAPIFPFHKINKYWVTARYTDEKVESSPSNKIEKKADLAVSVQTINSQKLFSNCAVVVQNNRIDLSGFAKVDGIAIYSIDGRKIYEGNGLQKFHTIESLPKGIYILSINSGANQSIQKIVKQ